MAKPVSIFVAGPEPIDTWWFEYTPGVTVLYGRNGTGKTRLLRALSAPGQVVEEIQAEVVIDPGDSATSLISGVLYPNRDPDKRPPIPMRLFQATDFVLDHLEEEVANLDFDDLYNVDDDLFDDEDKESFTFLGMEEYGQETKNLGSILERLGWIGEFAKEGLLAVRWSPLARPSLWVASSGREDMKSALAGEGPLVSNSSLKEEFKRQAIQLTNHLYGDGFSPEYASRCLFPRSLEEQVSFWILDRSIEKLEVPPDALPPQWAAVTVGPVGPLPDDPGLLPVSEVTVNPSYDFPGFDEPDERYLTELTFLNVCSDIEADLSGQHVEADLLVEEIEEQVAVGEHEGVSPEELKKLYKKRDRARKKLDDLLGRWDPNHYLFGRRAGPPEPSTGFVERCERFAAVASRYVEMLLLDGPTLYCDIYSVDRWADGPALVWKASPRDMPQIRLGLSSLSAAEQRWCLLAIELSLAQPDLVLIDEPERALHLRAQRHLAKGLKQLSADMDCPVVVSSHSPEMLKDSANRLVHVKRDAEGHVRTHGMSAPTRESLDDLGLDPVDVLQLTERFVIVEGEHDKIALDVFLGEQLDELRAVVLPMRGTTKLASTIDSQFLWDFTSAGIVIVLDNTSAELAQEMLGDLDRAVLDADKEAVQHLLDGWKDKLKGDRKLTSEEKKLGEFLQGVAWKAALDMRLDRINVFGFEKEDIVEYFDCATLVPGQTGWDALREQHLAHSGTPWKQWLVEEHNARFEPEQVHAAAEAAADSPVKEFFDLLEVIKGVPGRATT